MPWMVAMFGILVIPLGLSHIGLVMSQPVVVHHWSTLALAAALVMLPMIVLTVDEVVAMGQHVGQAVRRGDRDGSIWKVFWMGGTGEGSAPDDRTPGIAELPERPVAVVRSSVWGANLAPNLAAVAALGVWLLAAPAVFGINIRSGAADVAHIGGAVVIVVAVLSLAEVIRPFRYANIATAVGIAVATLLTDPSLAYAVAIVATAAAVAVLSLPRGPVYDSYGSWDRFIR